MLIERRQNPVPEMDATELDGFLNEIVIHFGGEWLERAGTNPICKLWHRQDWISTIELLALGQALKRMASHPVWLKSQVNRAKGDDCNNTRGALFEILALGQLQGENFDVEPTPDGFPGYDGFVRFTCGARMGVSLKSYDVSQHQRCFEGEAETAWELLTRHLKGGGKNAVEVYVFAESHCPSQGDWKRLRPLIARGCAAFSGRPCQAFEPPWFVFFRPLVPDPGIVIAHDALSSKLLIAVPRHKNDCKNLIDKLDDARANLERHAKTEGATANVILVRVPSDGSMTSCADWAKSYLEEHSTSPVSLIFLYQADVVRTDDGKGHYLCHHLMHVPGNAYGQWASQWPGVDLSLRLALPIGRVATQPSERWLLLPDGHRVSTENYYTFSRGYICADQTIGPDGKSCGELGEMSEGLFLCSVATVPGGRVVIQPKMATSHRLTII